MLRFRSNSTHSEFWTKSKNNIFSHKMQRLQPTLMAPNITIARIWDFESVPRPCIRTCSLTLSPQSIPIGWGWAESDCGSPESVSSEQPNDDRNGSFLDTVWALPLRFVFYRNVNVKQNPREYFHDESVWLYFPFDVDQRPFPWRRPGIKLHESILWFHGGLLLRRHIGHRPVDRPRVCIFGVQRTVPLQEDDISIETNLYFCEHRQRQLHRVERDHGRSLLGIA